jgi:hypothetical protein
MLRDLHMHNVNTCVQGVQTCDQMTFLTSRAASTKRWESLASIPIALYTSVIISPCWKPRSTWSAQHTRAISRLGRNGAHPWQQVGAT